MRGFWRLIAAPFICFGLLMLAEAALAQGAVQQSGAVVPFHAPVWWSNGVVADAGNPSAPNLSAVGLFNGAECPLGVSSQTGPGASVSAYGQVTLCQTTALTSFVAQGVNGSAAPRFSFNQPLAAPQVTTTATTFASLDSAPVTGERGYITDDNSACTFGTTATGGGATKCPVVYNGSNWVAG